jgi:hypothetical protein
LAGADDDQGAHAHLFGAEFAGQVGWKTAQRFPPPSTPR